MLFEMKETRKIFWISWSQPPRHSIDSFMSQMAHGKLLIVRRDFTIPSNQFAITFPRQIDAAIFRAHHQTVSQAICVGLSQQSSREHGKTHRICLIHLVESMCQTAITESSTSPKTQTNPHWLHCYFIANTFFVLLLFAPATLLSSTVINCRHPLLLSQRHYRR